MVFWVCHYSGSVIIIQLRSVLGHQCILQPKISNQYFLLFCLGLLNKIKNYASQFINIEDVLRQNTMLILAVTLM